MPPPSLAPPRPEGFLGDLQHGPAIPIMGPGTAFPPLGWGMAPQMPALPGIAPLPLLAPAISSSVPPSVPPPAPHVPGLQYPPPVQHFQSTALGIPSGAPFRDSGLLHPPPESVDTTGSRCGVAVPLDLANSKLWGVTSEYEHLLNIQRDQHRLALRQRDAEIAHLREVVDMLTSGKQDEASIASRLRETDNNMQLTLEAKQKELELLAGLLQMRDQQIGDLQRVCEMRQSGTNNGVLVDALREADTLRSDKAELERLLVAKDKQMTAVQEIDPDMSESSALQLGAKAIQMFHDSVRMKATVLGCGEENSHLRNQVRTLQQEIENLESVLLEKQQDVEEISTSLSAKTKRIVDLETDVERAERSKRHDAKEMASRLQSLRSDCRKQKDEYDAQVHFTEQLKVELADREKRLTAEQTQCLQHKACRKHQETKLEEMAQQLAHTEDTLGRMLQKITEEGNISKFMEYQCNGDIAEPYTEAEKSNGSRVANAKLARNTFCARSVLLEVGNRFNGHGHEPRVSTSPLRGNCGQVSDRHPQWQPQLQESISTCVQQTHNTVPTISRQSSGDDSRFVSNTPMSYCSHLVNKREHHVPAISLQTVSRYKDPEELQEGPARSPSVASRQQLVNVSMTDISHILASPEPAILEPCTVGPHSEHLRSPQGPVRADVQISQGYCPNPEDDVDLRLADFLNLPHNRPSRALFCRLSQGTYLYGTLRTQLRLHPSTGKLEAFQDGKWICMEDFVTCMMRLQAVHLQISQGTPTRTCTVR